MYTTTPTGRARQTRRALQFGFGALAVGAALGAAPANADAASSCTFGLGGPGGFRQTATITDGSGSQDLRVVRSGQFIGFADGDGAIRFCEGPAAFATVTNTDNIVVNGSPAVSFDAFIVDQSTGAFGPGLTPESDGNSEIETQIFTPGRQANLEVVGTQGPDTLRASGGGGVMVGADADVDIRYPEANATSISGRKGNDFLSGRGGSPASSPAPETHQVLLFGGDDRDTLVDRPGVGDVLNGGSNDDTLFSADGLPADQVAGGAGFDKGTIDANDAFSVPSDIEQLTKQPVGRLALTPATTKAQAAKPVRLKLSWTHPKSWKQLRTITLRLSHSADPVATIAIRPEDGRMRGHGAAKIIAGASELTHHGKTVTARLAVRLNRSLAGQDLRVDVEAVDRKGHKQLEPQAGIIHVAE